MPLAVSFVLKALLGVTRNMSNNEIAEKLRRFGYDRENKEFHIENETLVNKNYKDKTLNHSILLNCKIQAVFDNASATGSIFRRCEFRDCSIVQTDFEFCNFYDSYFTSSKKAIASFNGSSFINTTFEEINFEFCTFTGTLFEKCVFKGVTIQNSTLENAIFKDCIFDRVDLRNANTDYIEIDNPKMEQVKLSLSQVPYMFGCLQYIFSTGDNVSVGSQYGNTISISEYKDAVLPLLISFWDEHKESAPEYYFPLANVYIANGNYSQAVFNLRSGLKNAVIQHDFRIIKFYCKLISRSGLFDSSALYKFYNLIKRFGSNSGEFSLPDTQSFVRNIGEIESVLFSAYNKGKLFLRLKSNLSMADSEKIGRILGKLFSFSKMNHSIHPNRVEISLTENSPLMISLHVDGEAENIVMLINSFLVITKPPEWWNASLSIYPPHSSVEESQLTVMDEADQILELCVQRDIKLVLMEYHLENCSKILPDTAQTYYYFNDRDANYWQDKHLALI